MDGFEATKFSLGVFALGFVVSMAVAWLIKLTFKAIQASTKS